MCSLEFVATISTLPYPALGTPDLDVLVKLLAVGRMQPLRDKPSRKSVICTAFQDLSDQSECGPALKSTDPWQRVYWEDPRVIPSAVNPTVQMLEECQEPYIYTTVIHHMACTGG